MLASAKLMGFLLTKDYEKKKKKARTFYEGRLGFTFVSLDQYALVMRSGNNMLRIVKAANFTPLQSTVLGWEVEDIVKEVNELKQRGVVFEKYPFISDPELGIWTAPTGEKAAWFKDPDGNVLSLSHHS